MKIIQGPLVKTTGSKLRVFAEKGQIFLAYLSSEWNFHVVFCVESVILTLFLPISRLIVCSTG